MLDAIDHRSAQLSTSLQVSGLKKKTMARSSPLSSLTSQHSKRPKMDSIPSSNTMVCMSVRHDGCCCGIKLFFTISLKTYSLYFVHFPFSFLFLSVRHYGCCCDIKLFFTISLNSDSLLILFLFSSSSFLFSSFRAVS
jgi:hypothetical protein